MQAYVQRHGSRAYLAHSGAGSGEKQDSGAEGASEGSRYGQVWRVEMSTRYALIDPVLEACGWNIHDPRQVMLEQRVYFGGKRQGRLDYRLIRDGDPNGDVFLSAKALWVLSIWATREYFRRSKNALKAYVRDEKGVAVLTNGDDWYFYNLQRPTEEERWRAADVAKVDSKQHDECADSILRWLARDRPA